MQRMVWICAALLIAPGCYESLCPPPIVIDPTGTEGRRPPQDLRVVTDVPYREGALYYNTLDLYLPRQRAVPVVMYVHGCYWTRGDKTLAAHLGRWLASNGIAAVVVNYRMPPQGRLPEEMADVARAFAWTYHNIGSYGVVPPRQIILCGWSAGGHLVSLLTTNPRFLQAERLSTDQVRGVVSISGVYKININVDLGGVGEVFEGVDKEEASPLANVHPGLPPFLLLHCDRDLPTLGKHARQFNDSLRESGDWSRLVEVPHEGHFSEIADIVLPGAAYGRTVLGFIHDLGEPLGPMNRVGPPAPTRPAAAGLE